MLSQGHTAAYKYPLARLWAEAKIARRREGSKTADHIIGIHAAIAQTLASKATRVLQDYLESVRNAD